MEDELIKFETAVLAQEKGCDLELFGKDFEYTNEDGNECWTNIQGGISGEEDTKPVIECSQGLLQRWLREVHNIQIEIILYHMNGGWVGAKYKYCIYTICQSEKEWDNKNEYGMEQCFHNENENNTYEEALEKGLIEALKLI